MERIGWSNYEQGATALSNSTWCRSLPWSVAPNHENVLRIRRYWTAVVQSIRTQVTQSFPLKNDWFLYYSIFIVLLR